MNVDYAQILSDLQRLGHNKKVDEVFGASTHRFQLHPPLTEKVIQQFEGEHHIKLPAEYRGFLLQVGNGGAGPYYGLFKLGEMDDGFEHNSWKENDGFIGVLAEPFPFTAAWNDLSERPVFDESKEDQAEYDLLLDAWEQRVYWNSAIVNGALPICHLGCALRQWLIVTGPEAGNVWNDDRVNQKGLCPFQRDGHHRVSFLMWYRLWLNDMLQQLH